MTLPLLKLVDADAHDADEKVRRLLDNARTIADTLARSGRITRQALKRHMVQAFGASDADGAWTMRDAYDALETA